MTEPAPQDLVALYLRAQNLEQLERFDEAAGLYEEAVTARFDAAGPYDRLIAIYRSQNRHADVARVAGAAVVAVRTFEAKRAWYGSIRDEAREASSGEPADHTGAEF